MPFNMIGQLGSGAMGLIGSIVNTKQTNEANLQIARETNAANRQMVQEQNRAAAAESEKAYQRSKATTQVANMMQAGMSRAAAINALNGGGSYTPAPVNVSQDTAPQMQTADLSALANIGQAFAQRAQQKHDEKMQSKQLAAQAEAQKAQIESNERIAQLQANTTNRNADNRLNFDRLVHQQELQYKNDDLQFRKTQYEYGKKLIDAQTLLTNEQRYKIKAELDDFSSKPAKDAREAEYQLRRIAALYNYNVNENEFYKYLRDNFVKGEDGNYYPIAKQNLGTYDQGAIGTLNDVESVSTAFWNMMFSIIPVRPLLDCIKLFGK